MSAQTDPMRLMLDTNVWVDHFVYRGPVQQKANALIRSAVENDAVLFTSTLSLKDVAYLIELGLKRALLDSRVAASGSNSDVRSAASGSNGEGSLQLAAKHAAWACVMNIIENSSVAPCGPSEALRALTYKRLSMDFEDDLQLATFERSGADYLVTSDRQLQRLMPEKVISVDAALELFDC